jgi:hypothetical protein
MTTRWPLVVGWLVNTLPTLPGWSDVAVYDMEPDTYSSDPAYAVVGHTSQDAGSGNYIRQVDPSMLVDESGTVRVLLVTQSGDPDPDSVRLDGFALVDALEDALVADHSLGGILGAASTASLSIDVQSTAAPGGVTQALIVSLNYSSLTGT